MNYGRVSLNDCINITKPQVVVSEKVVIDTTTITDHLHNALLLGGFAEPIEVGYIAMKRTDASYLKIPVFSDFPLILK